MKEGTYTKTEDGHLRWCNTHQRKATHIYHWPDGRSMFCCDPHKGGIMMVCMVVDITNIAEIVEK